MTNGLVVYCFGCVVWWLIWPRVFLVVELSCFAGCGLLCCGFGVAFDGLCCDLFWCFRLWLGVGDFVDAAWVYCCISFAV